MGCFSTLDAPGCGVKQFKFKMGKMAEAARKGGFATNENVSILNEGSCTGYTLLWCREQFTQGVFTFGRHGDYQGASSNDNGGVGMLGVRLQALYQDKIGRLGISLAQKQMGAAVGLNLDVDNYWEEEDLQDALIYVNSNAPTVYFLDLAMRVGTKDVSHAIGAIKSADGGLYVFDSNCGEYLVKLPSAFAVNLESAYANLHGRVRFQHVCMTIVTLK